MRWRATNFVSLHPESVILASDIWTNVVRVRRGGIYLVVIHREKKMEYSVASPHVVNTTRGHNSNR